MAVTKIWTIKDSLQRVLDYAANPDKTEYDALAQTLHYAENDAKTKLNESAQLVADNEHWINPCLGDYDLQTHYEKIKQMVKTKTGRAMQE